MKKKRIDLTLAEKLLIHISSDCITCPIGVQLNICLMISDDPALFDADWLDEEIEVPG